MSTPHTSRFGKMILLASLAGLACGGGCSTDSHRAEAPAAETGKEKFVEPGNGRTTMLIGHPAQPALDAKGAVVPVSLEAPNEAGMLARSGSETGAGMLTDGLENLSRVTYSGVGSDFDPSVSRDGKTVVFASTQHRNTADIYVKSVGGRTVTQLTADPAQDVMPAISPDGSRVAFASNRSGSWDLYIMSIAGGQAVRLTDDASDELHPSWSPDGSRLAFCRRGESSGRWELWVVAAAKPGSAEFLGYGLFPQWCPVAGTGTDGRDRILFQRGRERGDQAFGVWMLEYKPGDASSPTEISGLSACAAVNPTWSPDGAWVVYCTLTKDSSASEMWMCDVEGASRVSLASGNAANLMPSWGGDGRVYFVSNRAGAENIWSIGTEKAMMAARGGAPGATAAAGHDAHGAHAKNGHDAPSEKPHTEGAGVAGAEGHEGH